MARSSDPARRKKMRKYAPGSVRAKTKKRKAKRRN